MRINFFCIQTSGQTGFFWLRNEYLKNRAPGDSIDSLLKILSKHHLDTGFDRTVFALDFMQGVLLERKGELTSAAGCDPFSNPNFMVEHGRIRSLNTRLLTQKDSLGISLMAIHFASLPEGYSRISNDLMFATDYAPSICRETVEMQVGELRFELLLHSAFGPLPTHGTYP